MGRYRRAAFRLALRPRCQALYVFSTRPRTLAPCVLSYLVWICNSFLSSHSHALQSASERKPLLLDIVNLFLFLMLFMYLNALLYHFFIMHGFT